MDYEAEYNNRARVPDHPQVMQGWAEDAAAYRDVSDAELDLPYGESARAVMDLFSAGDGDEPVAMFVHGGYWQALDKSWFSHMARGLNAHGVTVAVPSYDLCPAVSVPDIVDQIREACLWLWRRTGRRIVMSGHSAGGHLTAAMLATDWQALDPQAPRDLVPAGLAISGLFDLVPLVGTSINDALRLDAETARAASPLFWEPPAGRMLIARVGGAESDEYLRQSRTICEVWGEARMRTEYGEAPGANHFTVIGALADPDSEMTERLARLVAASTHETEL
ncbi:alpha/beta hydrolase [Kaustia mangrovi]|uniref:Alpha/beta hydrolase n=1 Tax=Kaustia mangrovi TaxID=2593653 RepID=A0A7S8C6R1_9HYPH|nr:alpha/beta hydrolase [Kaustia mangrovi]QPC44423.1 alpha/beta hydrolase [Kaustia mangrovi]